MKTGTGRIVGRVLASDSGAPIRRAQVRLTAPEIGVKTALTDAEGRFEFRELPAGRFTLNASKSGYVERAIRADAPVRVGTADRARRQAGARQGRHLDAARRRHLGTPDRRVRRSGCPTRWSARCGRRGRTAGAVSRRPAAPSDQRSRPVPDVRTAAGRVLRQRDAAQHRHHDLRRRDARRRCVGRLGLDAVVRLCADLFPGHDRGGECATRHGRHRRRKHRTPTSRWPRCASRGSAAR